MCFEQKPKNMSMCFKMTKSFLNVGKTNYMIFDNKCITCDHNVIMVA